MHTSVLAAGRGALFAAVLALGTLPAASTLAAGGTPSPTERLNGLETQAAALSQKIGALRAGLDEMVGAPESRRPADAPVIRVAQSRDVASLTVRMDKVEEQIRTLTGQVQGLQFQMTQLQSLIQKMQDDNEFRFKQLEDKTSGKKTDAAPQTGSVTRSGGTPQTKDQSRAKPGAANDLTPPGGTDVGAAGSGGSDKQLGAPPHPLGTLSEQDLKNLGVDGGALNLEYDPNAQTSNADAEAQYKAGYDAVTRGDYAFAEDQFRQFIALYPDDPKAPDAVDWLGEALIQRGSYGEAANVLFSGFQKYKDTDRGPDILLRLGIALDGTDQADSRDTACRTFLEVLRRYPDLTPAFKKRVAEAQKKAQC